MRRPFAELTHQEEVALSNRMIDAAIKYTDSIGIGGLSEAGSHNLYNAIQAAVSKEVQMADRAKRTRGRS